jgi:hypothetical protein
MLSEARGLLVSGWSRGAQARNGAGDAVAAWSDDARSWSLLGALLASWHSHNGRRDMTFVAHGLDARALGDATQAIGEVTGTASLDGWNDAQGRTLGDVLATIDRALARLSSP